MRKQFLKQKFNALSSRLLYYIILVSFIGFNSCRHQPAQPSQNNKSKKPAVNYRKTDSAAAPVIVMINAANQPKVVMAGRPTIKVDPLNGGVPFFTNYNTEQGLALSAVFCSLVDKSGCIWFGTGGGGVSRYDGKSFTNYTIAQGLAGNNVQSIIQDKGGNMWFGTWGGGASRYDGKSFTNYTTAQGLAGNTVQSIMQDGAGNIWFGTDGGGASRYDGKNFTNYTRAQGLADNIVWDIIQDKAGNIWFGTGMGGASRYDGKKFTGYAMAQGLADNGVRRIMEDRAGNIWFGTGRGGVSRYDGKSFTNYATAQGLVGNTVQSIMQDKAGNIWIGTGGNGVSRYDGKTFTNYTKADGLADNTVQSISEDRSGSIWFGTWGGGVSRYDGTSFMYYSTAQGVAGNNVQSIMQDSAGNIWFGSDGGGVTRYDGKSFSNYTTVQGLAGNKVQSIIRDKSGDLWFGTYGGGASRYDGKRFTNYTTAQGLAGPSVLCMIQDRDGNIWLGTDGGGVSRYNGKNFTSYTTAQGLAGKNVQSIMQDKAGNLWFGTYGGGASRYDGKHFTNYTIDEGLAGNSVLSITQDKVGNIWFGTGGGGASRYDGKTFTNYTTAQGLADNEIYALAGDQKRGIIWFGTNLGLSGLRDGSSSKGNDRSDKFEIFNKNTGYPIKDLNTNALFLDNNGILWAGCGGDKVIRFNYDAVNRNSNPLHLQIKGVKVNGEEVCWNNLAKGNSYYIKSDSLALLNEMVTTFGKVMSSLALKNMRKKYHEIKFDSIARFYPVPVNLELPYSDRNLTFDFAAIEPAKPGQVVYQYKLEGYDKDWSTPGNNTTAVFGNIPEGSYIFKLKALSPYGVWSRTDYMFSVLPPWYRTWWAYLVYVISSAAVIWCFVHYRSLSLLKDNRKLEYKVKIRTEEVLRQKGKIETQRDNLEKAFGDLKKTQNHLIQSEKMASLGELTAGIAHEIQNPLNFVNNFSEVNREMLDELEDELKNGNTREALAITADIKQNEEKINQHGKRADSIVKGMLQHSKPSSGVKELTDINKLTYEYMHLAYHGLSGKDKSFKAEMTTHFDPRLPEIEVVQQDIGRVLLNLFNNAFYAINQKSKTAGIEYRPEVNVTTHAEKSQLVIVIKDNGVGIPDAIKDKIMQPFFTTKPTGEGTGLGLSITYDMIVKGHGGNIKVNSTEGEGSEFIISLPVS